MHQQKLYDGSGQAIKKHFSHCGSILLKDRESDTLKCLQTVQIRSFFWSIFSGIRTEYVDLLCKSLSLLSPYMGKYGPKIIRIWTFFKQCWRIRLVSKAVIKTSPQSTMNNVPVILLLIVYKYFSAGNTLEIEFPNKTISFWRICCPIS